MNYILPLMKIIKYESFKEGEDMSNWIGVDIGGTKILGALFDDKGNKIKTEKKSSKSSKGKEKVIDQLKKVLDTLLEDSKDVKGIGIGVPGVIKEGKITFTPNMPLNEFNLIDFVKEEYKIDCIVENDANASMYGEWKFGAAKGAKNAVGYFVGTGIGGGLILNNSLYRGSYNFAAEIGHMNVYPQGPLCGCNLRGCLESLSSKVAIQREITRKRERGEKTVIKKSDLKNIVKSSTLKTAYDEGDKVVRSILNDVAFYLGINAGSIINLLNPDVILYGGGIMEALGEELLPIIIETAKQYSIPHIFDTCEFKLSKLKDDACLYGAFSLIREKVGA